MGWTGGPFNDFMHEEVHYKLLKSLLGSEIEALNYILFGVLGGGGGYSKLHLFSEHLSSLCFWKLLY